MIDSNISVSVIVPCRNEVDSIEDCVRSILNQQEPPGGMELLVVDGMSTDGTRDILHRLSTEDDRLRVIDNPKHITPVAFNIGIRIARGRYVAIFGAHAEYAKDYLVRALEIFEKHDDIVCSGGPIISRGKGPFGKATAIAMAHPIGVGNAKHRFSDYEGYAEAACFPVYRKDIFSRIGFFDETLVRNQDDEFSLRLAKTGEKVYLSPTVRSTYYVRDKPGKLFNQYFQYGYWRVVVMRKHKMVLSLRQLVPFVFYLIMTFCLIVGLFLPGWFKLLAIALPVLYPSVILTAAGFVVKQNNLAVGIHFPIVVMILHFSYALGFVKGLLFSKKTMFNTLCL